MTQVGLGSKFDFECKYQWIFLFVIKVLFQNVIDFAKVNYTY